MPLPLGSLGGRLTSVVTVTTVLPVLALFVPLLIIGVLAFGAADTALIRSQARPALLKVPAVTPMDRIRSALKLAAVPDQYRSLINPRAFEAAVSGGRPVLWLAALVALAFAVTR